jgi:hypothetical protein
VAHLALHQLLVARMTKTTIKASDHFVDLKSLGHVLLAAVASFEDFHIS